MPDRWKGLEYVGKDATVIACRAIAPAALAGMLSAVIVEPLIHHSQLKKILILADRDALQRWTHGHK